MEKFIIYKAPGCVWCDRAVDLIDARGFSYELRNVAGNAEYLDLFKANGWKTVPQIFHGDKHIGGHDLTAEYLKTL